eukprot:sb/3474713/
MLLSFYFMDIQALTPGAITLVSGGVGITAGLYVERVGAGFQFSDRGSVVEVAVPKLVSCRRLGEKKEGKKRSVKVVLHNRDMVRSILARSGMLREVEEMNDVHICPDRTVEERNGFYRITIKRLCAHLIIQLSN